MNKIYRILGKRGRITIPYEIRKNVGFSYNDVISFEENGSTITVKREKICDECKKPENKEQTLGDFLDSLSDSEQRAALIHLSLLWANKNGGTLNA